MPRFEFENRTSINPIEIYSLGGSTFFPERVKGLNDQFFVPLYFFVQERLNDDEVIVAFIGGGKYARDRQNAVKRISAILKANISERSIDKYGIRVTRSNAWYILDLFRDLNIPAVKYRGQNIQPGKLYLGAGDIPGHTTDYRTIDTASKLGVSYVINISNTPGLYPFNSDGSFDRKRIIQEMSFDDLIPHLKDHTPGLNQPIDKPAAILARNNGITYITLGSDIDNLRTFIRGEEFVGTIIRP